MGRDPSVEKSGLRFNTDHVILLVLSGYKITLKTYKTAVFLAI